MSNGRWNWFGFTNKDIKQLENQTKLNQLKLNQPLLKWNIIHVIVGTLKILN